MTNWITSSMLGAEYTQDMKVAQVHEWIDVAFHVRTIGEPWTRYKWGARSQAWNNQSEENQTKIKHDDFSMIGGKWMWVHNSNRSGVPDFNMWDLTSSQQDQYPSHTIPLEVISSVLCRHNHHILLLFLILVTKIYSLDHILPRRDGRWVVEWRRRRLVFLTSPSNPFSCRYRNQSQARTIEWSCGAVAKQSLKFFIGVWIIMVKSYTILTLWDFAWWVEIIPGASYGTLLFASRENDGSRWLIWPL